MKDGSSNLNFELLEKNLRDCMEKSFFNLQTIGKQPVYNIYKHIYYYCYFFILFIVCMLFIFHS